METKQLQKSDFYQPEKSLQISSGMAGVEQSRAVAETQAAMVVAQARPRDEFVAFTKIMKACERHSLAASSMYAYKRGGQMVEGPSIRLAEVLARAWGNMTYGLKETSRDSGSSEVEAFAWDLESNTRVTRQFVVNHLRDKKGGAVKLTSERDIYELISNMGQRRVRACVLEIIPGDITEEAVNQCKKTLAAGDGSPVEDRVRKMLVAFDAFGVTKDMVELYLQHKVSAIVPAQLVKLTQIYQSISTGVATRDEFFDTSSQKVKGMNEAFTEKEIDTPAPKGMVDPFNELTKEDKAAANPPKKSDPLKEANEKMLADAEPLKEESVEKMVNEVMQVDEKLLSAEIKKINKCKTSDGIDRWLHANFPRLDSSTNIETIAAINKHAAEVRAILAGDENEK